MRKLIAIAVMIAAFVLAPGQASAELRRSSIPASWAREGCIPRPLIGTRMAQIETFRLDRQPLGTASRDDVMTSRAVVICSDDREFVLASIGSDFVLVRFSSLIVNMASAAIDREEPPSPSQPGPTIDGNTRGVDGGGPRDRILTPTLVELMPDEGRTPRHGGSAVILLASPTANNAEQRNLVLCRQLFMTFDQATTDEIAIGSRIGNEGDLELLRPIYWITRTVTPGRRGADRCARRINTYDFPRRDRIARKLNLVGPGPYLVVEQHTRSQSERLAAVIDLSRTPTNQFDETIGYFRDGFMQQGDIWSPNAYRLVADGSGRLVYRASSGAGFVPELVRAVGSLACPLTNLLDQCAN